MLKKSGKNEKHVKHIFKNIVLILYKKNIFSGMVKWPCLFILGWVGWGGERRSPGHNAYKNDKTQKHEQ